MDSSLIIITACSVVILSYVFSIISARFRIPSVLLLLVTGMGLRYLADAYNYATMVPPFVVEALGTVGLIMIVLEAGLDLTLTKDKRPLIRDSFLSALVIFISTALLIAGLIYYWLQEPLLHSLVYAIPLSIMSSSIVLPSISHLGEHKKEFLVYEASFSDIIGIVIFNYFVAPEVFTWLSLGIFAGNMVLSVIISLALSLVLFYLLLKTRIPVKFFVIFAMLILLYSVGKMLHLPSLLIILVFGLMINNWRLLGRRFLGLFPEEEISATAGTLHSLTAETSFLLRTFFFLLFGFTININLLADVEVIMLGSIIVMILLVTRLLFLKLIVKSSIMPQLFYIPRGLITILLFYKIPIGLKLDSFNEGILFFVILVTAVIMMLGTIFTKSGKEVVEQRYEV